VGLVQMHEQSEKPMQELYLPRRKIYSFSFFMFCKILRKTDTCSC
jgi:hypothetical protein